MFTILNNNLIMVWKHLNVQIGYSISGTSSIDTTCTIWGLETSQVIGRVPHMVTGQVKTQLIAHDKEVYDIAFSKGKFWWIKMNHIGNQITNCIKSPFEHCYYTKFQIITTYYSSYIKPEEVAICLLRLEQMDRFVCLTYVIWSIQQLYMRIHSIPLC